MESLNLEVLEKNIFQQYKRDGALETILGVALSFIGLSKFLEEGDFFRTIVPLFVIVFILVWKRRITLPRLGYVEFAPERKKRMTRAIFVMLLIVFCAVVLAVVGSHILEATAAVDPATIKYADRLIYAGMLSVIIAIVGRTLQFTHLYYFAALCFLLFVITAIFKLSSGYAFGGTGLAFLIFGLFRVARFLKDYPLQESADNA